MKKENIYILAIATLILFVILLLKFNFQLRSEIDLKSKFETIKPEAIVDSQPDSFKHFILKNNTPVLLKNLKSGLDTESVKVIDSTLYKIMHMPDARYRKYWLLDTRGFLSKFLPETNRELNDLYLSERNKLREKYKFPKSVVGVPCPYVLWAQCNLRFANDKIKNYIKGKIFIDGGAYIGDSALPLFEFLPLKIYSFDLLDTNIQKYNETMLLNNIPKDLYEIHKMAIAGVESEYKISSKNRFGGIYETGNKYVKDEVIKSIDIDTFVKNKPGKVGFIHADLQGAMCEAIIGMKETIKRDRPVLHLDISNSPQEFFFAKPLLEKIVKNLNYTIKIIDYDNLMPLTTLGVTIWAYPNELDD